jgi:ADP-ribose pyrophosphatase YjhB (NUDIX family)
MEKIMKTTSNLGNTRMNKELRQLSQTEANPAEYLVTSGQWGEIPWQFFASQTEIDPKLCTAAFCIVTYQGQLVLVQHGKRGYEFPGGHIDGNETAQEAVRREIREESGVIILQPTFFGYKKVSPLNPIPHRDKPNEYYPFPHSYVPYYFAEASEIMENPMLTPDVATVKLTSWADAQHLLTAEQNHQALVAYLLSIGAVTLR